MNDFIVVSIVKNMISIFMLWIVSDLMLICGCGEVGIIGDRHDVVHWRGRNQSLIDYLWI